MKVTFELNMDFNQLADLFTTLSKFTPANTEHEETITLVKADCIPTDTPEPREAKKTTEPKIEIDVVKLRQLVQEKIQAGHKEVIKAKVTGYGAASISTVPEEKYTEFFNFLNAL